MRSSDPRTSAARRSRASALASSISSGSSPASALLRTGMPSAAAISSAPIAAAKRGAESGVSPRTWMLPRPVTSMTPLPCACAASHSAANASNPMVPIGRSRTSHPSPVGMGVESPGQDPRRCTCSSRFGAEAPATGVARFCPNIAALMSLPGRTRRAAPRGRRRHRCVADARNRAAAWRRAARRSPPQPADFPAAESRAP